MNNELPWKFLLSPIWVPAMIYWSLKTWFRTRKYIKSNLQESWKLCTQYWISIGKVYQANMYDGASFPHELAVKIGRHYRSSKMFFVNELYNKNPLIAAYALKCLIRTKGFSIGNIPREILDRRENIYVSTGCVVDDMTIGEYVEQYIKETEFLLSEK